MDSVTICNMALMAAGIPAITSFEENNNSAKLCKTFFPVLRDRVLRDHNWSFATAYYELPQAYEDSPDPEYPFVCHLPGDVIRIIKMADDSPFRRVGRKVFVSKIPATCVYTRRIEDPNLFDCAFTEALQNLLAAEMALSSSRDIQMAQYFRNEYERKLVTARSIDSQENVFAHQPGNTNSSFLNARKGVSLKRSSSVVFVEGNAGKQI